MQLKGATNGSIGNIETKNDQYNSSHPNSRSFTDPELASIYKPPNIPNPYLYSMPMMNMMMPAMNPMYFDSLQRGLITPNTVLNPWGGS
jgi:hypothetical protein